MGFCAANLFEGSAARCDGDHEPHVGEERRAHVDDLKRSGSEIGALSTSAKRMRNLDNAASEPSAPPMVVHTRLHASHHIAHVHGIFYCQLCGFYASSEPRKLALPCARKTTRASQLYLDRIAKGMTPRARMAWPNPISTFSGVVWESSRGAS